jgi:hypothetical protein
MTTAEIIAEFTTLVNVEQEYTLGELKSILSDVYKVKTGKKVAPNKVAKKAEKEPSDDEDVPKKRGRPAKAPKLDANGDVKKKREPSLYNIFIKERRAHYKLTDPELSSKECMLRAAAEWTAKKEAEKEPSDDDATDETTNEMKKEDEEAKKEDEKKTKKVKEVKVKEVKEKKEKKGKKEEVKEYEVKEDEEEKINGEE